MRTVKEVSELTGVSVRTLQYYDTIGLLSPSGRTDAGYRLYDDAALEKLQQILLFRELEFSLGEIKAMMDSPDFDRNRAIEQQIELLKLKREHLDNLIRFAIGIKLLGVRTLDFSVFQKGKLDEYSRRARELWENSPEYQEFARRESSRTQNQDKALAAECMAIFKAFGELRHSSPDSDAAQALVKRWHDFISEHFYHCSKDMLRKLASMYTGGGEFMQSIDAFGGEGTAVFVEQAIAVYCK